MTTTIMLYVDGSSLRSEGISEHLEGVHQWAGRPLCIVFPGACASRCWLTVRKAYMTDAHAPPLPGSLEAEILEAQCAAHPRVERVVPSRETGGFWQKLRNSELPETLYVASDDSTGATSFLLSMGRTQAREIVCFTSAGSFGFRMTLDDAVANRIRIQGDLIRAILRGDSDTVPGILMEDYRQDAVPEKDDIVSILRDECVPLQKDFVKRVSGNTAVDVTGFLVDWLFQGDGHAYSRCVVAYVDLISRIIRSYQDMEFGADLIWYPFDVAPGAADVLVRLMDRAPEPVTAGLPPISTEQFASMVGRADQLTSQVQEWLPSRVTETNAATGLPRVPFRRRTAVAILQSPFRLSCEDSQFPEYLYNSGVL